MTGQDFYIGAYQGIWDIGCPAITRLHIKR